ncbi:MAG: hypothetical protein N3H31_03760 [Candidatus Nezhaarchaeota archaeon]|nr:hypothetical protein [Candidatus Nezhaarchaeota archaeon]
MKPLFLERLELARSHTSSRVVQLGVVKDGGSRAPFHVELDRLRCLAIVGPRWARSAALMAALSSLYSEGLKFAAVDTGRRLRALLFSGIPVDLYRVGLDSSFNPFASLNEWGLEESHSYASLASRALVSCAELSTIHACILELALSRTLEEGRAPSVLEVIQSLEAQLDPASIRHRAVEELKAALGMLQLGYASASILSAPTREAELDPSRLTVVELSYLPTADLKCFYQACLLARLLIKARRSSLRDAVVAIEGFDELSKKCPWCFEDLVSPLVDLGLYVILACSRPTPGATLTLTLRTPPQGHLTAVRVGGLEVELNHHSWAASAWSDLDVDKAVELRLGALMVRLKAARRRRLTTLEELFTNEGVRRQVYEALSYLRDSYSSFKALFELMALPREEARRALIKMYRHGLITQRDVGGVKVVALSDYGRLVLEEYESQAEAEGDGDRVE